MSARDLKNRQNARRSKAWKHFYPEGHGKAKDGYVLHHKDETLLYDNPERYLEWRIEDLVMISLSEHSKLHNAGKHVVFTEEHKNNISKNHHDVSGSKNPMYGHRHTEESKRMMSEKQRNRVHQRMSEETKRKLSEKRKGSANPCYGKHPYNNGIKTIFAFSCPDGFVSGILKKQ